MAGRGVATERRINSLRPGTRTVLCVDAEGRRCSVHIPSLRRDPIPVPPVSNRRGRVGPARHKGLALSSPSVRCPGQCDMATTRTYSRPVLPTPVDVEPAPSKGGRRDGLMMALAAIAMIAFAWSGFQSAEWVRVRFLRSDVAASLSEDALEISAEADRLEERDIILYVEWLVALDTDAFETAEDVFLLPPTGAAATPRDRSRPRWDT